jgi:hypothetical protein
MPEGLSVSCFGLLEALLTEDSDSNPKNSQISFETLCEPRLLLVEGTSKQS